MRAPEMSETVARGLAAHFGLVAWRCHWLAGLRESGAALWRVDADDAGSFFLRCFGPGRGFSQAQGARREWGVGGRVAPEIVAVWPASRAWLERWIEPQGRSPHEALAHVVRILHTTPAQDRDSVTLRVAWERRCRAALERARPRVPDERLRVAEARLARGAPDPDEGRVPCHRDLHPGNWIWDGARTWLVDFEHARLDWAVIDVAALERATPGWLPALGSASPRRAQLDACHLLWALQTVARAPSLQSQGLGPRLSLAWELLRAGGAPPRGQPARIGAGGN